MSFGTLTASHRWWALEKGRQIGELCIKVPMPSIRGEPGEGVRTDVNGKAAVVSHLRSWRLRRSALLIAGAIVIFIPYIAWCVHSATIWLERPTFKIASGTHGGLYYKLGVELAEVLSQGFENKIRFENLPSKGSNANIESLETGAVQLALAQDGLDSGDGVRALAGLYNSPFHLVVPRAWKCKDLSDLRRSGSGPNERLRVFLGAIGSGTRTLSLNLLEHYGMSQTEFDVQGSDWTFEEAASALISGKIDAAAFLVGFGSPALERIAAADERFTLLPLSRTEGIKAAMPYLEKVTIFAGSYPSKYRFPDEDVPTVATRELLIASSTMSERHAFKIVETLFSSSSKVVAHFPLLTQLSRIEPERNFYYPLHPGATAFYRRSPRPSLVTPERVAAALSYSASITAAALIFFRRRRMRALLADVDAIAGREIGRMTPATYDTMVSEMIEVQKRAFNLHKDWRIKEEGYNAVKEYVQLRAGDLKAKLASVPSGPSS